MDLDDDPELVGCGTLVCSLFAVNRNCDVLIVHAQGSCQLQGFPPGSSTTSPDSSTGSMILAINGVQHGASTVTADGHKALFVFEVGADQSAADEEHP